MLDSGGISLKPAPDDQAQSHSPVTFTGDFSLFASRETDWSEVVFCPGDFD